MDKSPDAFRTISEVAEWLQTPAHVLRFWESKFTQVKPVKRAGGRRYYRPADMMLLGGIKRLLHDEGMTIKGVQKILREQGVRHVASLSEQVIDEDGAEHEAADDDAFAADLDEAPFAEDAEPSPAQAPIPFPERRKAAAGPGDTPPDDPEAEGPGPEHPGKDAEQDEPEAAAAADAFVTDDETANAGAAPARNVADDAPTGTGDAAAEIDGTEGVGDAVPADAAVTSADKADEAGDDAADAAPPDDTADIPAAGVTQAADAPAPAASFRPDRADEPPAGSPRDTGPQLRAGLLGQVAHISRADEAGRDAIRVALPKIDALLHRLSNDPRT